MDDADIAELNNSIRLSEQIRVARKVNRVNPDIEGDQVFCLFCGEPFYKLKIGEKMENVPRWCCVECRDDWQAENPDL